MNRTLSLRLATAIVLWWTVGPDAAIPAESFFMGLGDLPGGAFSSFAYGVSADGSVVVGQGLSASGAEAFRWTQGGGMIGLGALPDGSFGSIAFGTSEDGSVVVGESGVLLPPPLSTGRVDAFRWTQSGGMEAIPFAAYGSTATDVSSDGSVVVGTGTTFPGRGNRPPRPPETEAFRWSEGSGSARLGDLPGGLIRAGASGVSADGSVVVGHGRSDSGTEAFRWTASTGMVALGDLPGGSFSSMASAVSADGSVIVGYGSSASGSEAFRWTQGGGMVGLGILPGFISSRADDVSADGSVVVGWSHSASDTAAFLWSASSGIRSLRDVLVNDFGLGASLDGWNLEYARGISADGRVVVGYGFNPNGDREAWIARLALEPTIPGDFNNDGTVDTADYVILRKNDGTQEGYNTWRANFGASLGGGSGAALPSAEPLSATVPEPAAFALLSGSILILLRRPRTARARHSN